MLFLFFLVTSTSIASISTCDHLLNENARISPENYKIINNRTLFEYKNKFGNFDQNFKPGDIVIESGAGMALASIELAVRFPKIKTIAVNTQNFYDPLLNESFDPSAIKTIIKNLYSQEPIYSYYSYSTLRSLIEILSPKDIHLILNLQEGQSENNIILLKTITSIIKTKLLELQKQKRWEYQVGFSEEIIARYSSQIKFILDYYGAFFYSAQRFDLLTTYNRAIKKDGKIFIFHNGLDDEFYSQFSESRDEININEYLFQKLGEHVRFDSKIEGGRISEFGIPIFKKWPKSVVFDAKIRNYSFSNSLKKPTIEWIIK